MATLIDLSGEMAPMRAYVRLFNTTARDTFKIPSL